MRTHSWHFHSWSGLAKLDAAADGRQRGIHNARGVVWPLNAQRAQIRPRGRIPLALVPAVVLVRHKGREGAHRPELGGVVDLRVPFDAGDAAQPPRATQRLGRLRMEAGGMVRREENEEAWKM